MAEHTEGEFLSARHRERANWFRSNIGGSRARGPASAPSTPSTPNMTEYSTQAVDWQGDVIMEDLPPLTRTESHSDNNTFSATDRPSHPSSPAPPPPVIRILTKPTPSYSHPCPKHNVHYQGERCPHHDSRFCTPQNCEVLKWFADYKEITGKPVTDKRVHKLRGDWTDRVNKRATSQAEWRVRREAWDSVPTINGVRGKGSPLKNELKLADIEEEDSDGIE